MTLQLSALELKFTLECWLVSQLVQRGKKKEFMSMDSQIDFFPGKL